MLSILLSIVSSNIPWGEADGFHGTGVPFASVYWDYKEGYNSPIDYPNPLAPFLNCITIFSIGMILIIPVSYVSSYRKKKKKLSNENQRKAPE